MVIKADQIKAMERFLVWREYGSSGRGFVLTFSGNEILDAESDCGSRLGEVCILTEYRMVYKVLCEAMM